MKAIFSFFDSLWAYWRVKKDPVAYARNLGVNVGSDVRLLSITPGAGTFGSEPYLIKIGNHVTVTGGVRFITHDGGVWIFREAKPAIDVFGPIVIGNNVFIGYGAIILPNVKVGDNCIIAAGSVVVKDIPAGSVAGGVPAKVIKTTKEYESSLEGRQVMIRSLPDKLRREKLEKMFEAELFPNNRG